MAGYEGIDFWGVVRQGKGAHEPNAQTAGAYPGFFSMKHLGVLLLPPGQEDSPSQGYSPQQYVSRTHLYTWVKRDKWSKVPCLRKQRDGRGLSPAHPDPEFEVLTTLPHTPPLWEGGGGGGGVNFN